MPHATVCRSCPLCSLDVFRAFSPEELTFMEDFKSGETSVDAGTPLLMEQSNSPQFFTVLSGMGVRYKMLENGRRQVINFIFPGDFVGLQAGVLGEMRHSVEATTAMTLCIFRRDDLWRLYRSQPTLAFDVTWISAAEEHFLGETIATLGQRDATERIAWALLRLYQRIRSLGLGKDGEVPLPYRQQDLANSLGLSLVHTNKVLGRLRARRLARWADGTLSLPDREKLAEIAMVDLEKEERRPLI